MTQQTLDGLILGEGSSPVNEENFQEPERVAAGFAQHSVL
jgi:hypothetical protein